MRLTLQKPDIFGAIASTLCVIHCLATPIIFLAHSCSTANSTPIWWSNIDYIFVAISFFAVYRSSQTTSKNLMKWLLWINWVTLALLITNVKIQWIILPEIYMYFTALMLAIIHIYNLNYCQCKTNKCCTKNG